MCVVIYKKAVNFAKVPTQLAAEDTIRTRGPSIDHFRKIS